MPSMLSDTHVILCLRLLLAAAIGAVIGLERELAGKAAGLRTNLLVAVGATLFTHVSLAIPAASGQGDPARVAAQVVTGVGFLGAGTILHARGVVHGLTSAATLWVVAALGVAVGAGATHDALLATGLVVLALLGLRRLEERYLGAESVSLTLACAGASPDPGVLLPGRRLLHSRHQARPDGSGSLTLTWRGAADDFREVAARAERLPGVRVEGWEVER